MEVGIDFKNIISYNENMAKGLSDKLFFLNNLKFHRSIHEYLFVDFGCADGTLINAMYEFLDAQGIKAYYIGYDISETMIDLAKTKFTHYTDNVLFTSNWDEVEAEMKVRDDMQSVSILSSVIHEVYSYAENNADIDIFWDRVLHSGFKYICIRDMMCSKDINRETNEELRNKLIDYVARNPILNKLFNSFRDIWGPTTNNKNFIHFLLKYRWQINWEREVHENYFPLYIDEFLRGFTDTYNLTFFERFRVPFLDKCFKEDLNIELEDYTHIKAIFEAKKN